MALILSIDTAFSACNIGLWDTVKEQGVPMTVPTQRGQAEHLIPLIDELMQSSKHDYTDLDLIVVTVGPGSFTGLRVGISAARGLALALDCPVQGVVTTDALYATLRQDDTVLTTDAVRVVIDTKRDDFYVAAYGLGHSDPIDPATIRILNAVDVQDDISKNVVRYAIGDGAFLLGLEDALAVVRLPDPCVLARYGWDLFNRVGYDAHARATPLYLRDAEVSYPKNKIQR